MNDLNQKAPLLRSVAAIAHDARYKSTPLAIPSSSVAWKSGGYWLLMRSEAHQARKCFPGAVAEIIILASNNLVSGFPNERDYLCSFR